MKRFEQLSETQQKKAINESLTRLLEAICEGGIRFNDKLNHDDLQARIDAAFTKAESMQTPWFVHEYLLDTCREELEGIAQCQAEDAIYSTSDEHVIAGIA